MATSSPHPRESATRALFREHSRLFEENRYVYPVLSRRSCGLSVGINLNPDKICNFDCIYCQVDRTVGAEVTFVDHAALLAELEHMLDSIESGAIYEHAQFRDTPEHLRRLNDIAFSGDGEPTTYAGFEEIVSSCAETKQRRGLRDVKLVLITNATMLHRTKVRRALETLDANQGEVWAKLEAGTEAYYRLVERTSVPLAQVLRNITDAACIRPLVIQALFMRIRGAPPPIDEQQAFCDRLNEIAAAGGRIKLVQVYTVARRPAVDFVGPLTDSEVDDLVSLVRARTGLHALPFYSGT